MSKNSLMMGKLVVLFWVRVKLENRVNPEAERVKSELKRLFPGEVKG